MQINSPGRFLMFAVDEIADELSHAGRDIIKLTLGKSDLPLRSEVIAAMVAALTDVKKANLVYPAGLPELRAKLAEYWSKRHSVSFGYENVVVSTGTSTLFRNLFACLTAPDDEILIPVPYYPLYLVAASLAHLRVRFYEINPHSGRISLESLSDALTERTRLVVVNSPGNPLGNQLDLDDLADVDALVNGRSTIISDEIYGDQVFASQPISALDLESRRSPLVVTSAFSKGFRMYTRRIGYCIASTELIQAITCIQDHTLLTTDPVPQFGALEALNYSEDVAAVCELHQTRRDATVAAFNGNQLITPFVPAGGFYFTIDCEGYMTSQKIPDSLELAKQLLLETGVAAVPGADFGMPTALRLSFTSARYVEAVDRMADFFH